MQVNCSNRLQSVIKWANDHRLEIDKAVIITGLAMAILGIGLMAFGRVDSTVNIGAVLFVGGLVIGCLGMLLMKLDKTIIRHERFRNERDDRDPLIKFQAYRLCTPRQ